MATASRSISTPTPASTPPYLSDGRRKIYGNFAPLGIGIGNRRGPVMVCDGGPAFFGVEYDVERREITGLAFNGYT